jgi:hypothetical protein
VIVEITIGSINVNFKVDTNVKANKNEATASVVDNINTLGIDGQTARVISSTAEGYS